MGIFSFERYRRRGSIGPNTMADGNDMVEEKKGTIGDIPGGDEHYWRGRRDEARVILDFFDNLKER